MRLKYKDGHKTHYASRRTTFRSTLFKTYFEGINHIFFGQNTSCIRKPQIISGWGVRTPRTLPLDPPLLITNLPGSTHYPPPSLPQQTGALPTELTRWQLNAV